MATGYPVTSSKTGNRFSKWKSGYHKVSLKLHDTHLFIGDVDILIYKLYTRWSQNK